MLALVGEQDRQWMDRCSYATCVSFFHFLSTPQLLWTWACQSSVDIFVRCAQNHAPKHRHKKLPVLAKGNRNFGVFRLLSSKEIPHYRRVETNWMYHMFGSKSNGAKVKPVPGAEMTERRYKELNSGSHNNNGRKFWPDPDPCAVVHMRGVFSMISHPPGRILVLPRVGLIITSH